MTVRPPRIMIVAGEPSGDRLGAGLAAALRQRCAGVELMGMGGEGMSAAGVRLVRHSTEVAVVGLVEVLSHLPSIRRVMAHLDTTLRREKPDLLVPVDFPDFNLRLAARARRAGVPVVYFVSPQVWAWRRGRIRSIRRLVRRMLVLFEFETEFYRRAGVPVTFVGHPLAEQSERGPSPAELRRAAKLDPERPTLALLPGSRSGEVTRQFPAMLAAAKTIQQRRPDVQFLVSRAHGVQPAILAGPLAASSLRAARVHAGDFPEILSVCAAGVVAAGTASLEAAVVGLPSVVVYRMNPLTHALGRMLVRTEHVALPNLVAGRRIVPELIQNDCRPDRIVEILLGYLEDPARAAEVREALRAVRRRLGPPGVFGRAAEQVLSATGWRS